MALTLSIDFKGITIPGAYVKINSFSILNSLSRAEVYVHYMADSDSLAFHSKMMICPYDINGENPIKQGYEFLKTLEEFSGAEYC